MLQKCPLSLPATTPQSVVFEISRQSLISGIACIHFPHFRDFSKLTHSGVAAIFYAPHLCAMLVVLLCYK